MNFVCFGFCSANLIDICIGRYGSKSIILSTNVHSTHRLTFYDRFYLVWFGFLCEMEMIRNIALIMYERMKNDENYISQSVSNPHDVWYTDCAEHDLQIDTIEINLPGLTDRMKEWSDNFRLSSRWSVNFAYKMYLQWAAFKPIIAPCFVVTYLHLHFHV